MEKLVSSWYNVQTMPEDYVFPVEQRPGEEFNVPVCSAIPVIDLRNAVDDPTHAIQKILNACQEFGFFQVINHGISANLIADTLKVTEEFFTMPNEDKASVISDDRGSKSCQLYTSTLNYANEKVHFWRDNLKHPSHPLEDFIHLWPEKPTTYREIVGKYSVEVRNLSLRILELISVGLGLAPGFFVGELSDVQVLSVNHYPPCPEPSLSLGLPKHCDPSLITLLLQGMVYGLQVFKDGNWIGVEPLPNAFVVNIGHQLQIISNRRLRSVEHRAVTNWKESRTTIASFIYPSNNCVIEPAKVFINEDNPSLFKTFQFHDFLKTFMAKTGDIEATLEDFMV